MKTLKTAFGLICLSLLCPVRVRTQDVAPLPVDEALSTRSFNATQIGFSPDGKWLAYTVKENQSQTPASAEAWVRRGVPWNGIGADICLFNTQTGETKSLPGKKSAKWGPSWSPDGHYLAFFSDSGGTGRLWIWDVAGDELRKVSDIDVLGTTIQWMPDSHRIMVEVPPLGTSRLDLVKGGTQSPQSVKPSGSTVVVYRASAVESGKEAPQSDPWKLNSISRDLVLVDIASGKENPVLHGRAFATYRLSPDGSRLAYTSPKRFEKPGSQQVVYDLVVVTLSNLSEQVVATDIRLDLLGDFSWSPDGRQISFETNGSGYLTIDCYVVDVNGGVPRNITMFPPLKEPSWLNNMLRPRWSARGDYVYLLRNGVFWRAAVSGAKPAEVSRIPNHEFIQFVRATPQSDNQLWTTDGGKSTVIITYDELGKQEGFFKIDLTSGQSAKLLENRQCYYRCTALPGLVSRDERFVAYLAQDAQHDFDLWMTSSNFWNQQRLTHLNPQFDKYRMGSARLIDWLGDDGQKLQGALLLPSDYREGRRYPLIVSIYGGISQTRNFNQFGFEGSGPWNMQLLATRGYAVLLPDAPQHLGTPMRDLAKSVLPGVNKAIELGFADPERLGVVGVSYGGYSTLSLIVQTKRFKAAVEVDGYADLVGSYGEMDKNGTSFGVSINEESQGLMGGPPWEHVMRYVENSPIFYLDRVETPLLIAHGAEDPIVAPFLGDEVFVGLRRLGKEVEYAKYMGEGHGPSGFSLANQIDFCVRMTAWFNKYLQGHKE